MHTLGKKMRNYQEETVCMCALNRIFGYEPGIAAALLDNLGSAKAVFGLGKDDIMSIFGPHSKYAGKICLAALDAAWKELEEAARHDTVFIGRNEPSYPALLKECGDSPAGIYVRSLDMENCLSADRDYIAVVGTRRISQYGSDWCRKIVRTLAESGRRVVIVSGLAYGTDITAHTEALRCGLGTIAVMATGTDTIYPAMHYRHAMKIAGTSGSALVSDYPLHTKAIPVNFVRRNRIIAGLSRATILIESGARGGGMITARQAFSYDREIYVLPGRADDPMSAGCNALLRQGTAIPVTSLKDLAEDLGYTFRTEGKENDAPLEAAYARTLGMDTVGEMAEFLLLVKRHGRLSLQDIADMSGMGYRRTAEIAGILQNDGFIAMDLMQRCSINRKNF